MHARAMREVIMPTLNGMAAGRHPYTGFLYAGLMIAPDGSVKTCWNSTAAWATRKPSRS
jgi:phosphoribosylamine--glycine ligase